MAGIDAHRESAVAGRWATGGQRRICSMRQERRRPAISPGVTLSCLRSQRDESAVVRCHGNWQLGREELPCTFEDSPAREVEPFHRGTDGNTWKDVAERANGLLPPPRCAGLRGQVGSRPIRRTQETLLRNTRTVGLTHIAAALLFSFAKRDGSRLPSPRLASPARLP
ncbi:hypothetical protein SKAU_G00142490 [Synaphobranchus kaupii]|uniref:Uncharacterized protein n=1 Tax=Synaphobranchus kaupii TaxID=118154 RepID=A0A9Q1J4E2_SYNKA|nr:hypothetical protein SKAU_G00142490 [Synaphobranchus kaupii]